MNCATIDSILDERRVAGLNPVERQEAAEHVGGCARCTEAWSVDEALRADVVADPPPELFAALVRRVAVAAVRPERARRGPWAALVGTAAAIALLALGTRWAIAPDSSATTGVPADVPTAALAAAPAFVAGRDYEVLRSATALPVTGVGIPVLEFFMYLCFPCYSFEASLVRWDAETASQVALTRVPAVFYPPADLHARAFYTAEVLGKLEAMHPAFYEEIHTRGNPLDSRAALAELFARFGVAAATFDATFDSSEVDARVRRAIALSNEYAIRATPTFVVAGRYRTNANPASPDALAIVDHLVAKERAESCPALRGPECR